MSDHERTYGEALAEVKRIFAATPRTTASANPPDGQLPERVFPSIGVKALREHCGCPDALLATAMERLQEARNAQGPFGRPAIEDALDLIALARWWMKSEAWRPTPLAIRKPTQLFGAPSKQPKKWDLSWWRGGRQ